MQNDDDLREDFRELAREDESGAPDLVPAHLNAWRSTLLRQSRRTWTAGMIAGMAAGAVMMLTIGGVLGIRQVSNGGIIVNDGGNRQMRLFDSTLTLQSVVRDSVAGTATSYGPRGIPMTPYLGDSTILADYNAGTMVVMGPNGQGRA